MGSFAPKNHKFYEFLDWLARSCGGVAVDCLTMYGRPKWSTSLRCIHPCHSLHGYSSHYSFIFSHSLLRVGGTGTINASSSLLVYFLFFRVSLLWCCAPQLRQQGRRWNTSHGFFSHRAGDAITKRKRGKGSNPEKGFFFFWRMKKKKRHQ